MRAEEGGTGHGGDLGAGVTSQKPSARLSCCRRTGGDLGLQCRWWTDIELGQGWSRWQVTPSCPCCWSSLPAPPPPDLPALPSRAAGGGERPPPAFVSASVLWMLHLGKSRVEFPEPACGKLGPAVVSLWSVRPLSPFRRSLRRCLDPDREGPECGRRPPSCDNTRVRERSGVWWALEWEENVRVALALSPSGSMLL